jgi:hypothetical protein
VFRVSIFLLLIVAAVPAHSAALKDTSCTTCHSDPDLFDEDLRVIAENYRHDIHATVGLSCHDCHGGNPTMALADDISAMDEDFAPNPYQGAPARSDIPGFCAECHSDPSYMRRFKPDIRVDQEKEYWTSQHGKALADGDERVATCVDCHGIHGIRQISDPDSSVYPARVAETCGSCHSDPQHMAGYQLPNGSPLPVDQHARWSQSVHAAAMFERGDLTAPTCNDCHGNHGANPPGLDSVTFVCGQCHGREAEIFRDSPKYEGFQNHNEYLADAGEESCSACHKPPQALVSGVESFVECITCHGNHGVIRPNVAMFAALPTIPCAFCHEDPNTGEVMADEPKKSRDNYEKNRNRLLAEAAEKGLEGEKLFNWLVDQAQVLPAHSVSKATADPGGENLSPEFAVLFAKFRIGKTYYTYDDPITGEETRAEIVRCGKCHLVGSRLEEGPIGARSGIDLVRRMQELTSLTARAERTLLAARRGGVETRDALLDVDQAVDAQIALEVLVHTFSTAEDGPFMEQYTDGIEHAKAALSAGHEALDDLKARRQGLALWLIVVLVVLIALALKIRQVSEGKQDRSGSN